MGLSLISRVYWPTLVVVLLTNSSMTPAHCVRRMEMSAKKQRHCHTTYTPSVLSSINIDISGTKTGFRIRCSIYSTSLCDSSVFELYDNHTWSTEQIICYQQRFQPVQILFFYSSVFHCINTMAFGIHQFWKYYKTFYTDFFFECITQYQRFLFPLYTSNHLWN